MKRSEIRGCCVAYEKPGLRCAPSGLRLLRLLESSRIPMSDWAPVFLLPNLRFKDGVSIDEAAIVPSDDPRVRAYVKEQRGFGKFIKKFTDPFGAKTSPAVMIVRNATSKTFRTLEAVS